ncbi:hypothetical protein DL93DRAFT_2091981 [Clavulina sp. PMI_390]|nr:hypothetical protein DL93DRAFT_2091980 [Clavulina sp. PMI_390]KAF8291820.1 hypothetical protein DL93DRAFT_2091981 [Clavulina sp. PMI_390]
MSFMSFLGFPPHAPKPSNWFDAQRYLGPCLPTNAQPSTMSTPESTCTPSLCQGRHARSTIPCNHLWF